MGNGIPRMVKVRASGYERERVACQADLCQFGAIIATIGPGHMIGYLPLPWIFA